MPRIDAMITVAYRIGRVLSVYEDVMRHI